MEARRYGNAFLLVALGACALGQASCAALVRKPTQAATEGAVAGVAESVRAADVADVTSQVTIGIVRGLARAAEDPALSAGIERIVAAVSRGLVAGMLNTASSSAGSSRQPVAGQAEGAGQTPGGGVADVVLKRRVEIMSFVAALSTEVGRGLARGIGEEVARQAAAGGGQRRAGPIGEAIATTAGRASAAAVRGALDAAAGAVPCDEGIDRERCLQQFARGLSRASAAGASEAVQQKASPWPSIVAFGLGAIAMLLLLAAWRTVARRRSEPTTTAPRQAPTPA